MVGSTSQTTPTPPKSLVYYNQATAAAFVVSPLISIRYKHFTMISMGFFVSALLADLAWGKWNKPTKVDDVRNDSIVFKK